MFKLSLLLAIFFSININAQEVNNQTFTIIENPNNIETSSFIEAIEKTNFECFRFLNTSRILTFKNGLSIELVSFQDYKNHYPNQSSNCFLKNNQPVPNYILELINGVIVIEAPLDTSIKQVQK
jgi:hypothetical protein